MSRFAKPMQVLLYQDVLCAWCYLAESRLQAIRDEFRDLLRWSVRPYPLRVHEALPSPKELEGWAKDVRRARQEPDGERLRADIWTDGDVPRASVPALAALEAARLQGESARALLARAMQRAALEQGVNVTRADVAFELASRAGLNMNRFSAAFQSPQTHRLILEEHRLASERGVKGVPTVVIGGRWMISGLRDPEEYRELFLKCLQKAGLSKVRTPERILH